MSVRFTTRKILDPTTEDVLEVEQVNHFISIKQAQAQNSGVTLRRVEEGEHVRRKDCGNDWKWQTRD